MLHLHTLITLLLLLLLSSLPTPASSLDCHSSPTPTPLPLLEHCQALLYALAYASRLPPENSPKTWGRGLPSNPPFTEHLPKLYWLPGRGPQTCGLTLDVDPLFPDAREVFRLEDVAVAGVRIVNVCLVRRRELGREWLGEGRRVVGKVVRMDARGRGSLRGRLGGGQIRTVEVPGVGELAWMEEVGDVGSADEVR
ncbi:MAG: hypothetical protein Q9219_007162 [cf. Caloplaca sp. 3 TL-2023]